MSKIKDLSKFSAEKLEEFLTSFDTVLSDIDGELQLTKIATFYFSYFLSNTSHCLHDIFQRS